MKITFQKEIKKKTLTTCSHLLPQTTHKTQSMIKNKQAVNNNANQELHQPLLLHRVVLKINSRKFLQRYKRDRLMTNIKINIKGKLVQEDEDQEVRIENIEVIDTNHQEEDLIDPDPEIATIGEGVGLPTEDIMVVDTEDLDQDHIQELEVVIHRQTKRCLARKEEKLTSDERAYIEQITAAVRQKKAQNQDENDIIKQICRKPERPKINQEKSLDQKINEAVKVAEYFFLLNETQWNLMDDDFYVINRRWFDKWKSYVSYDYIVKHVMDEKRSVKELSINKIINSGCANPGDITNKFLLMDSKDFYHNRVEDHDFTNYPLKEDLIYSKDYILCSRGIWQVLYKDYDGLEIVRYSIVKDKLGKLFRDAMLPKLRISLMRRGDKLKYPKVLHLKRKTTFIDLKNQLKNVFQFLSDVSINEIRFWILKEEMLLEDFIDQYNQGIADNLTHTYEFPGQSLERILDHYVDEHRSIQNNRTVFIEVKRSTYQWLFNLDQSEDAKYFRPNEGDLFKMPYMMGDLDEYQSDFFEYGFSYNQYWKIQNGVIQGGPVGNSGGFNRDYDDMNAYAKIYEEQIQFFQNKQKAQSDINNNVASSDANSQLKNGENEKQTILKCGCCLRNLKNLKHIKCPQCHQVLYCNQECLTKDLKFHTKKICDSIKSQNQSQTSQPQPNSSTTTAKSSSKGKQKQKKKKRYERDLYNELEEDEEWKGSEDDLEKTVFAGTEGGKRVKRQKKANEMKVVNDKEEIQSPVNAEEDDGKNQEAEGSEGNDIEGYDPAMFEKTSSVKDESSSSYSESNNKRKQKAQQKAGNIKNKRGSTAIKAPASKGNRELLQLKDTSATSEKNSESSQEEPDGTNNTVTSQEKGGNNSSQSQKEAVKKVKIIPYKDIKFIVGHGLSNIGNSCYMNAIVQVLANNHRFRMNINEFVKNNAENCESTRPICFYLNKLIQEIKQVVNQSSTINPSYFKQALAFKSELFNGTEQFDAHEFLQYLEDFLIQETTNYLTSTETDTSHHSQQTSSVTSSSQQPSITHVLPSPGQIRFTSQMPKNLISNLYGGLIKQVIYCKQCQYESTKYEPFNILSLPIEFDNSSNDKATYARLKVIYIYEVDKYRKYEILIKPGMYQMPQICDKIKSKISQDRRELKSGKKEFVLVDLMDNSILQKVFIEQNLYLTFQKSQELTTFAYEVPKGQTDKLLSINFIHMTKEVFSYDVRKYLSFPRLILFSDTDSIKNISFKIFKEMRNSIKETMFIQPNFEMYLKEDVKQAYDECFFGADSEQPYQLYLLMRDGIRHKVDIKLNRKLFKAFDLNNVLRLEAEFLMAADFMKMRAEFNKIFLQPSLPVATSSSNHANEPQKVDLETCIRNFARPELLEGENQWFCEGNCKAKTDAIKYTYLQREPEFLCIHLRRFKIDKGIRVKLENIVKFPIGKLRFSEVFHQGSSNRNMDDMPKHKYTLQSIVQHQGYAGEGGHYITFCRDEREKDDWYLYDDSKITKISQERKKDDIVNKNSYLLFYRRKDEDREKDRERQKKLSKKQKKKSKY